MLTPRDLEAVVRRAANYFGIDIHRYHPERIEPLRVVSMLRHHRIDVVLDVGANVGQFATSLRVRGFQGKIISFEPLQKAYEELVRASKGDQSWVAVPRTAIGDHDGEVEINIAANSESSSILSMLGSHERAAPESRYVGSETAPICRLDSIAGDYLSEGSRILLKIDTQGYEGKVLDGAANLLRRVVGVQLELSLVPLYAGQELMPAMVERMRRNGFDLWSLSPSFVDPSNGRILQFDGLFFR